MNAQPNAHENLNRVERWLERFSVVLMMLLLAFFVAHQVSNTGFFTVRFGTAEMLCLYVPIVIAMIAPLIRAQTGLRQPARLWSAASSLLSGVTGLWLLTTFPFNFAHFTDIIPGFAGWIFFWLNDDLAKIPLVLQVIIGPLSAIVEVLRYLFGGAGTRAAVSR